MLDFFARLVGEEVELKEKIRLLTKFLDNNSDRIDEEQTKMMHNQLHHMQAYRYTLENRIKYERALKAKR